MKRIIILLFITLSALSATAQRYVINVAKEGGEKQRVDTRAINNIHIAPDDEQMTATMNDGSTITWPKHDITNMAFDYLPPRIVHYTQSIENDAVHRFITETQYDLDDYEYTLVKNYANTDPSKPIADDEPHPLTIRIEHSEAKGGEYVLLADNAQFTTEHREEFVDGEVRIWNATPGDTLYYKIMEPDGRHIIQEGIINATGQVRMIYAPSVNNIRDLGGWPVVGGGHIRYGRLYRGAKFHDANNLYLSREDSIRLRKLNIKCEFDLRGGTEAGAGQTANYYSRLGRDIDYRINGHGMYAYYNAVAVYPEYFRYGWNMVKAHIFAGDPIFVHCSHGCDRMGTWAMVIEGVLGVCENDLNLDYELSAFAPKSGLWRYRNEHLTVPDYDFRATINYIKSLPGDELRDKFEYFLVQKCRIPQADIDRLRKELIVK